MSITMIWLIAGAAFIAIEMGLPGLGFLFAGIGALVVGGAIEMGLLDITALIPQFVVFFAITTASAALLWKKLKRDARSHYTNMLGDDVTVLAPGLSADVEGQVKWSGTIMRARLATGHGDTLAEGAQAMIHSVEGNLLFVRPKA